MLTIKGIKDSDNNLIIVLSNNTEILITPEQLREINIALTKSFLSISLT
jgi:hypothetical protein